MERSLNEYALHQTVVYYYSKQPLRRYKASNQIWRQWFTRYAQTARKINYNIKLPKHDVGHGQNLKRIRLPPSTVRGCYLLFSVFMSLRPWVNSCRYPRSRKICPARCSVQRMVKGMMSATSLKESRHNDAAQTEIFNTITSFILCRRCSEDMKTFA